MLHDFELFIPERKRLSQAICECLTKNANDRVKIEFTYAPEWNMIQMEAEKNAHRRILVMDACLMRHMNTKNLDEYMGSLLMDAMKDIDHFIEKEKGMSNEERRSNPEDDK